MPWSMRSEKEGSTKKETTSASIQGLETSQPDRHCTLHCLLHDFYIGLRAMPRTQHAFDVLHEYFKHSLEHVHEHVIKSLRNNGRLHVIGSINENVEVDGAWPSVQRTDSVVRFQNEKPNHKPQGQWLQCKAMYGTQRGFE